MSGTLDKADGVVRFTRVDIRAVLTIDPDAEARAQRILRKAKETCLISNSLSCEVTFDAQTSPHA